MSTSLNLIIRDKDTGVVRTGLSVKLFNSVDGFITEVLTAVELGGYPGVYQFTYDTWVNAKYKLKVNGTFDPTFGGDHGVWIIDGDNIISLNGDGHFDAKSKRLINLAECVDDNDGVRKIYLTTNFYTKSQSDARYGQLSANNTWLGPNTFADEAEFTGGAPSCPTDPTLDDHLTRKEWVAAQIENAGYASLTENNTFEGNQIVTGTVLITGATSFSQDPPLLAEDPTNDAHATRRDWVIEQINNAAAPYQESINVIRLMPGGIQQTNKVYTSWSAASNAARLLAGDLQRMTVEIRGAGDGGATITPSDGGIPSNEVFNSYVSYKGINQNVLLKLSGTEVFGAHLGGIISDLTFYCDDPDADITFEGFIFNNVYFDFQDSTALNFSNCTFRGGYIKVVNGSSTYTNCKGGNVISNTDLGDTIQGWGGVDTADF